jgi:hypothetical protein
MQYSLNDEIKWLHGLGFSAVGQSPAMRKSGV